MVLPVIGSDSFPRTKRFDARDRLALVHNAKRRTTGVRPRPAVPFRPPASSDGGTIFGILDRGIGDDRRPSASDPSLRTRTNT